MLCRVSTDYGLCTINVEEILIAERRVGFPYTHASVACSATLAAPDCCLCFDILHLAIRTLARSTLTWKKVQIERYHDPPQPINEFAECSVWRCVQRCKETDFDRFRKQMRKLSNNLPFRSGSMRTRSRRRYLPEHTSITCLTTRTWIRYKGI